MSAGMSICFIYWCISFDIVSRAPITTGMTTTLTFETFCNSILKFWYFSVFSYSLMAMFWSPEIAKSIIWHYLFCLSIQTMSGRLCSITLFVWTLKSHRILYSSFSWTDCGVCVCTTCNCIVSDTFYRAASACRSQPCHDVFCIDV